MHLENANTNETASTNEFTESARRFVLPLKVENSTNNGNLVTLKDCKATATVKQNSGAKPKVFLEPQHLTKDWMELPRINYQYNGEKYNYFYSISSLPDKSWTIGVPDSVNILQRRMLVCLICKI